MLGNVAMLKRLTPNRLCTSKSPVGKVENSTKSSVENNFLTVKNELDALRLHSLHVSPQFSSLQLEVEF